MLYSCQTATLSSRAGIFYAVDTLIDAGYPAIDISLFCHNAYLFEDNWRETAQELRARAKARGVVSGNTEEVPETVIAESDLVDGKADIMSLLVLSGLCASRSDARRNIQQGGVLCGDEKVTDIAVSYSAEQLRGGVVLRRGKKNFKRVVLK